MKLKYQGCEEIVPDRVTSQVRNEAKMAPAIATRFLALAASSMTKAQRTGRSVFGPAMRPVPTPRLARMPLAPKGAPAVSREPSSIPGGKTHGGTRRRWAISPFVHDFTRASGEAAAVAATKWRAKRRILFSSAEPGLELPKCDRESTTRALDAIV